MVNNSVATTIQVEESTRRELLKVASELQGRLGRKVSFDETIMSLIERARGKADCRSRFESLYASMEGDKVAWLELRKLKGAEKGRLERIAKVAR